MVLGPYVYINFHWRAAGDVPRVDGQLVIAKAFGDKRLKIHLSSEPDITHQAVGDQNEFIVFASDGI